MLLQAPRDSTAALIWLQYSQRYGLQQHVNECEHEVAQHYLELCTAKPAELELLSAASLRRISQAYVMGLGGLVHRASARTGAFGAPAATLELELISTDRNVRDETILTLDKAVAPRVRQHLEKACQAPVQPFPPKFSFPTPIVP